jgi:hypothetical protein
MDFKERASGLLVPDNVHGVGVYTGTIIRGGYFDDDGVWHCGKEIVDHFCDKNLLVGEGLTSMLGVYLHADTQLPNWFVGLFSGNYTPVDTVTGATIASAATETVSYSSSTRPAYVPAAASAKSITNSASRADFVFTSPDTIYGAFLISDSTRGGTAGVLLSAARFAAAKPVSIGDELLLTYTFTLASA